MSKVLQAKLKTQEGSNGQFKFSTLQMGMPVSYRIYTKIRATKKAAFTICMERGNGLSVGEDA